MTVLGLRLKTLRSTQVRGVCAPDQWHAAVRRRLLQRRQLIADARGGLRVVEIKFIYAQSCESCPALSLRGGSEGIVVLTRLPAQPVLRNPTILWKDFQSTDVPWPRPIQKTIALRKIRLLDVTACSGFGVSEKPGQCLAPS